MPSLLTKRGGAGYSLVVANLIRSLYTDDGAVHYVNVPNQGTLPELPSNTIVEVPVIARQSQLIPLNTGPLPEYAAPLIQTMAEHYRLLIQAVRNRSKNQLRQALLIHPLFGDADMVEEIIEELLVVNKGYIAGFR